jgi:membrane protein DedA with SNARE-associated domain
MDKDLLIKLLAGTITRGLLWVVAFFTASLGVEKPEGDWAEKIGLYLGAVAVAMVAIAWSWVKNKKLLKSPPR